MTADLSSVFPGGNGADPHAGVFAPQGAIYIKDRDTIIPTFYKPEIHADAANIVVKQDGQPVLSPKGSAFARPFTVAPVPPERRWAILADGNVMDQQTFTSHYHKWYLEQYKYHARDRDVKKETGNVTFEHIPNVVAFVSVEVDPHNRKRFRPTNYDPDRTRGAVPSSFVDRDGEKTDVDRLALLTKTYHENMASLLPHEIREVEASLGVKSSAPEDIAGALSAATSAFTAGDITQAEFNQKVAALTGAELPAEPAEPTVFSAKCGKEFGKLHHMKTHESNSKSCKCYEGPR